MKKTIIANWGHADQGKSATIKLITQLLLQQFPNTVTTPVTIDFTQDIKVVIELGGIRIGIESQGDPNSRLFSSLIEFAAVPCDLIICATRTSGATVDAVNAMKVSDDYDIIWVTNYRSNEKSRKVLNRLSAESILVLIKDLFIGVV